MKPIYFLVILSLALAIFLIGCDGGINIDNNREITEIIENDKPTLQDELKENNLKEQNNIARIIFAGDTMMDGNVAKVMKEKGIDYPLTEFMPILNTADLVVINLETAVGTSGRLMEKTYAFQTHPDHFALFQPIRDKLVFSLANNHGMDAPLEETMVELNKMKMKYIGVGENIHAAFKPYVEEINGVSIGILAASRVIPVSEWRAEENRQGMATAYTYEPLISYVKEWTEKVDHVIVSIHWGEELADLPNDHQINLNNKLVEAGARAIIGTHPHVIQEIKWQEGQLTAFSLGNFVFTTSRQAVANDLIALELHLSKEKIEMAQVWPGKIEFGLVQHLEEAEEKQRVFGRLRRLSPTIRVDENGVITPK